MKKNQYVGLLTVCFFFICALLTGGCGRQEEVRVGSLKGPTSLGILFLMDRAQKGETEHSYEFRMAVGADELLPLLAKGELDIGLLPANGAAVLYQKTQGAVAVIDVNTLGVLYLVTGTEDIRETSDLKGRTIYLTGKGTTPEASLRYILKCGGLSQEDYALEFRSEPSEVAALLAENPSAVGLLPQPFVTAALLQNGDLKVVLDLNQEWEKLQGTEGSGMVTGVTVVRREFLEENLAAVEEFLQEHRDSVAAAGTDVEKAAALAVEAGIVGAEPVARQAIPQCNIVCITGREMKEALSGYLEVLYHFDQELVGGALPGEDFYYLP